MGAKGIVRLAGWLMLGGIAAELHGQGSNSPIAGTPPRFDGVLRTLVDTQMNFGNSVDPYSPVPQGKQNVNSQQLSQTLVTFANTTTQLISGLQMESRYNNAAQLLLGDAIKVRSTIGYLTQRMQSTPDAGALSADFAALDRQWRLLSHQVKQLPNVSSSVLRQVETLDKMNDSISKAFRFDPQVERTELSRFLSRVDNNLQQLAEDIDFDLFSHPRRDQWARQIGDLQSRINQTQIAASHQYPYEDVVRSYKLFFDGWMTLKRDLRGTDNRYIQRNISRTTQANERIRELLWLPPVIDGRDIQYLAESLNRNVDTVTAQLSMQQLIAQPNAIEIFKRARAFYEQGGEFQKTVASVSDLETIKFSFKYLESAWGDLKNILVPIQNPQLNQSVELLERSVAELRASMGLQLTIDRTDVLDLAATLNTMTDLLAYDVTRFVGQSNRYPPQFRNEAGVLTAAIRKSAGQLYQSILQDPNQSSGREQFRQLNKDWTQLQGYISKIEDRDRAELARSYQQIAPAIAKLQVIYGAY